MGINELLENEELSLADKLITIRSYLDKDENLQLSSAGQEQFLKQAHDTSKYTQGMSEDVKSLLDEIHKIREDKQGRDYTRYGFREKIEKILNKYY